VRGLALVRGLIDDDPHLGHPGRTTGHDLDLDRPARRVRKADLRPHKL
jgi:hypothetical protein